MMPQESESIYERNASVRLRQTAYGGAAFWLERAATVELDEEAFALLCWLALPATTRQLRQRFIKRFARNVTLSELDRTINQLKEYGFVCSCECEVEAVVNKPFANSFEENHGELSIPNGKGLQESSTPEHLIQASSSIPLTTYLEPDFVPFAPESVHLQLNNVCNLRCPSCYVSPQMEDSGLMPVERWMTLVDEIADMGVFQLALGGGEPLMSSHFVDIVLYSRRKGLLPNVTTNGHLLTKRLLGQIRGSIGEVRLSFNDGVSVDRRLLTEKSALLNDCGIRFGYSVIVTHHNVKQLETILRELIEARPCSITLIRPKLAPNNERWYAANALSEQDSILLGEQLNRIEPLFVKTLLTVDCAFSYLFHNVPDKGLILRGVAGCAMGERFVVVARNGDVYPCSHLNGKEFKLGNVTQQSFHDIWEKRSDFTHSQAGLRHIDGHCGRCTKRQFCGGCRAIAWHISGDLGAADDSCPFNS